MDRCDRLGGNVYMKQTCGSLFVLQFPSRAYPYNSGMEGIRVEVYLEVVILDNLFFDWCLVHFTTLFWLPRPKRSRMLSAAVLGTVYAVLAPLRSFVILQHIIFKTLVSALMVFIVYGKIHIFDFIKRLLSFWIAAAVMAGALYAIGSLFFQVHATGGILFVSGPPLWLILLSGILVEKGIARVLYTLKRCVSEQASEAQLHIRVGKQSVSVRALLDTGSTLHDPVSGLPIVLLPRECIHKLYPDGMLSNIQTGDIRFQTVTGSGSVRAMKSDEIWIIQGKYVRQFEAMIATATDINQLVAIVPAHATLVF